MTPPDQGLPPPWKWEDGHWAIEVDVATFEVDKTLSGQFNAGAATTGPCAEWPVQGYGNTPREAAVALAKDLDAWASHLASAAAAIRQSLEEDKSDDHR